MKKLFSFSMILILFLTTTGCLPFHVRTSSPQSKYRPKVYKKEFKGHVTKVSEKSGK